MKIDFEGARLYVRPGSTDLRKGVTGLLSIIENEMHLDALSNSVFFFCNKSHRLLKIIFWNKTGFWLAQKRLEMATWPWPNTSQEAREFTSKTESLKKLYESQSFLFDAEEMGIKIENQCPEISDEDIAQALNDDLFDRKSERKKPGRTRNKSKNLPRQKYVIDLSEEEKISEADFLERRVKEVKPHMDTLHSWLLEKKQAERSVKSWVMARRNFLFSGSGNRARASCFIKGLLQTLKTAKSRL